MNGTLLNLNEPWDFSPPTQEALDESVENMELPSFDSIKDDLVAHGFFDGMEEDI